MIETVAIGGLAGMTLAAVMLGYRAYSERNARRAWRAYFRWVRGK